MEINKLIKVSALNGSNGNQNYDYCVDNNYMNLIFKEKNLKITFVYNIDLIEVVFIIGSLTAVIIAVE